jgi:hypothetical protein
MEFVVMERLWADSSGQDSYDPYTCAVNAALFLECLDIAGPRTLGSSLSDLVAYNMTGSAGDLNKNFYAVLALEGLLNMSGSSNVTGHFGGDVSCSGKTVGDGAINAYDIATLMWYQFKFEPYDLLSNDPSVVSTVQGRDDTGFRCNIGETRRMWQIALGEDYCHNGQNAAMLGYESERRLSQRTTTVARHDVLTTNLFDAYVDTMDGVRSHMHRLESTGTHDRPIEATTTTDLLTQHAKETRLPESRRSDVNIEDMLRGVNSMRSLDVDVAEWAFVEGYGRWIRIRAPGVQVAMELYMAGVTVDQPVHMSLQSVPTKNCTSCKPQDEDPRNLVVAFARRTEYEDEYANAVAFSERQICADIVPATVQSSVMLGNTIAIRQQPPNKACGFDVFMWVPRFPLPGIHISKEASPFSFSARRLAATGAESAIVDLRIGCGSEIGVLSGSSAMDGFRGQIQRMSSCTRYGLTRPDKIVNVQIVSPSSTYADSGGQCSPVTSKCNPSAPARNEIVSRSFHPFASSGLEFAYAESLKQLLVHALNATETVQFEAMLARDSGTNNCCQGFVCAPAIRGNSSSFEEPNGRCQIAATVDGWPPAFPPPLLPLVLQAPPPSMPPPEMISQVVFTVSVIGTSADEFDDTTFKTNVAYSAGVSMQEVDVHITIAEKKDYNQESCLNITTTIIPIVAETSASEAALILASIATTVLPNVSVATQVLGVQVQSIIQAAQVVKIIYYRPPSPPPPVSSENQVGVWIGLSFAIVSFVALVAAAIDYLRTLRKDNKRAIQYKNKNYVPPSPRTTSSSKASEHALRLAQAFDQATTPGVPSKKSASHEKDAVPLFMRM